MWRYFRQKIARAKSRVPDERIMAPHIAALMRATKHLRSPDERSDIRANASKRANGAAGGGAEALDQRLRAVEHGLPRLDVLQPRQIRRAALLTQRVLGVLELPRQRLPLPVQGDELLPGEEHVVGRGTRLRPPHGLRGDRLADALRHLGKPAPGELRHDALGVGGVRKGGFETRPYNIIG